MSTHFRLELIEPSAREVFIFWILVEREERGGVELGRIREHGSNLARLETASELKKKLMTFISVIPNIATSNSLRSLVVGGSEQYSHSLVMKLWQSA